MEKGGESRSYEEEKSDIRAKRGRLTNEKPPFQLSEQPPCSSPPTYLTPKRLLRPWLPPRFRVSFEHRFGSLSALEVYHDQKYEYLEVMSGTCVGHGASRLSPARRKMLYRCISGLRWKLPVQNSGVFENYEVPYLSIILEDATMLCDDPLRSS